MGLLDQAMQDIAAPVVPGATPSPSASTGSPDVLEQVRQRTMQQVPEQYQDALQRVVLAGKKVLYSKDSHGLVEEQLSVDDPVAAAGEGAVELLGLLAKESRGTMPKQVAAPAMLILLTDVLDYLKQTGRAKGDAADLDSATRAMTATVMKAAGVSPEGFQQIAAKAHEAAQRGGMQNGT